MSERTFFIGSVGPLLYDDTDKAYEDSDMLSDDIVAPLQKALWGDVPETSTNLPVGGSSDSTVPGAVTGIVLIESGMGGITIGWDPPVDTPDVDNYSIYWSTTPTYIEGTTALVGTVPAPVSRFTHVYTHPLTTAFTCYYWVKAIDSSKNISVLAGPLTVVATTTYDDAISKVVNSLLDNPVENGVTFKLDKLKIGPGGTEAIAPVTVFTIGTINGLPAIAIKGDMFVDGSINARALTAGSIVGNQISASTSITLNTGGTLAVGASDVLLSSAVGGGGGRLQVWDRTAGGNNRSVFYRGALAHYNDISGETICQVPPRQIAMGYGAHDTIVEIDGEFPFVPTVTCSPSVVRLDTTGLTRAFIAHPGPVTQALDAGRYQFKMFALSCNMQTVFMVHNFSRVYSAFSYPTLPSVLWWPGSNAAQYQQMTTITGGIARLFVQIKYRSRTNSGYGIKGNFELQVGYLSGGSFVATDTATNAYESYADQDWRSVWILCTPVATGRQYAKVKFTPTAYIPSRYEGIGNRIEYYIANAVVYSDGWTASWASGSGSYIAYA